MLMKNKFPKDLVSFLFSLLLISIGFKILSQEKERITILDEKVKTFLDNHRGTWRDMNVPESDGKILYELIIKNDYKTALEIGTSTGYSAIWIAWALSKTGGKLITIEIDKERYRKAINNFKDAGLADYIDARLADAHKLVMELEGTFDFVFCDADKGWYKNYFIDIYPKLNEGGCYTAHNVTEWSRSTGSIGEFYNYIILLPDMNTTIDNSGNGISISYKRSTR
jgi:caffeoyl-CoA O-methyltransferase